MEAKKISEVENPLFSRKELHLEVKSGAAPSYEEVKNLLKEKFSYSPDLVRIQNVKGRFGSQVFDVHVHVYSSAEEFKRVVKKTKQEVEAEKKVIEEKAKAEAEAKKAEEAKKTEAEKPVEEKPAEAPPVEEKPAEEPTKEVKEEEKTEESKAEEPKAEEVKAEESK